MSKKTLETELENLVKLIMRHPEGITLQEILSSDQIQINHRSLQRRLALLIKQQRIITIGKSRARRYKLPDEGYTTSTGADKEYTIALSSASKNAMGLIRKPLQERTPVSYNRNFLDKYRPNLTAYLPPQIANDLLELGKTDGERPAGTYAREIFNRLLIDLSWNSSRLEGNTYSLLETELLLKFSEAAEGKDLRETQMILNHKAAIEFLIDSVGQVGIDMRTILNIHSLLSDNLLADPGACGCIRSKVIGIAKSVYQPLAVPGLLRECLQQVLDTAKAIQNPLEQAFFLMVHIPYLQPFEDVNKRVSRLVSNIPLIQFNLSPLSFMDVPQKTYINGLLAVYELNNTDLLRDVFIWAYKRSCALYSATRQSLGEPDPFRLKYRNLIFETVASVVRTQKDKKEAIKAIRTKTTNSVPLEDQSKFIETIEIELRGLHEGNIARYRLTPTEYEAWNRRWREA